MKSKKKITKNKTKKKHKPANKKGNICESPQINTFADDLYPKKNNFSNSSKKLIFTTKNCDFENEKSSLDYDEKNLGQICKDDNFTNQEPIDFKTSKSETKKTLWQKIKSFFEY